MTEQKELVTVYSIHSNLGRMYSKSPLVRNCSSVCLVFWQNMTKKIPEF